jgi:hypothetical protein
VVQLQPLGRVEDVLVGEPGEGAGRDVPDGDRCGAAVAQVRRRAEHRRAGPVLEPGGGDDPGLGIALLDGQHVDPVHLLGLVPDVAQPVRRPVAAVLRVRARALAALGAQRELDERHGVVEVRRPRCRVGEPHGHHPDRGVRAGHQADLTRSEAPRDLIDPRGRVDGGEHF